MHSVAKYVRFSFIDNYVNSINKRENWCSANFRKASRKSRKLYQEKEIVSNIQIGAQNTTVLSTNKL